MPPSLAPQTIPKKSERHAEAAPTQSRFAELPSREAIGKPVGAMFSSQSWQTTPEPVTPVAPVAPPSAPAMPFRVAGRVFQDGALQIILARGDLVLNVREGDTLDGVYLVERIRPEGVTLVYLPLGVREELRVNSVLAFDAASPPVAASGASAAGPATLRWEGPPRVSAGSAFDVALKLTSSEPVRAAPLQLKFDAHVLEPVAVRAGGFFSGGPFSYRVNPGGSIFVGAAGNGGAAADAEFLVVRFKPLRPAASAELKVSSIVLQGPGGRVIAHEEPVSFRTVVQ